MGRPTTVLRDAHRNDAEITRIAWDSQSNQLASRANDGTLKLWDLRAAGCQREYESGSPINSVALHPNQVEIVSGDRDGDSRSEARSAPLVHAEQGSAGDATMRPPQEHAPSTQLAIPNMVQDK